MEVWTTCLPHQPAIDYAEKGGESRAALLTVQRGDRAVFVLRCGRGILYCGCQGRRPAWTMHVIIITVVVVVIIITNIIITIIIIPPL